MGNVKNDYLINFFERANQGLYFINILYGKKASIQQDSNSDRQSRRSECRQLDHHHGPVFFTL